MRSLFLAAILSFSVMLITAQTPERDAIKSFCGCYDVTFEYAETFPRKEGYQLAKPYTARATELIILEEETPEKLVLQHMLVINDSVVIKHWRQDWEYTPQYSYAYVGNDSWEVSANAKQEGQWTQKVFEVTDSPRYAGSATWNLADGRITWENTTDAPLPRREYTSRDDYHILRRTNRLIIEDWGWIHEQDNEKIVLGTNGRESLVEEKGRNTYRRIADADCSIAKAKWEAERTFWLPLRSAWEEMLRQPGAFAMQSHHDRKTLTETLSELQTKHQSGMILDQGAAKAMLQNYCLHVTGTR
jgi:hypothetical protein